MALLQRRPPPRWVSLGDGTTVLFTVGMVRPGPGGLYEARLRETSVGFFAAFKDAKRAVETRAQNLGLLPPEQQS